MPESFRPELACGQAADGLSRHLLFVVLIGKTGWELNGFLFEPAGADLKALSLLSLPQQSHTPQADPSVVARHSGLSGHRRGLVVALSPAQILEE